MINSKGGDSINSIIRLSFDIKSFFDEQLKDYDLTFHQWQILKCIKNSKNNFLTSKDLIEQMCSDKATIALSVKKLNEKNFISIVPDSKDKRKKNIYLTEEMLMKCEELKNIEKGLVRKCYEGMSKEEIELLNEKILKIRSNINEKSKSL